MTTALAALGVATLGFAAVGCGRELLGADEEPISPNTELRASVETPEAPKPPKDVDDAGRLLAADGLVSGFEVPKGLKLLRRERGYLEFEVTASAEALREFWTGLDNRTGRRFTERRYLVEEATVGFDVNHTRETLDRLRLGDEYKEGYIYVAPGGGRTQRVRVHPPRVVVDPEDDPFIPKLEPAGPGNAPTPRGAPPAGRAPAETLDENAPSGGTGPDGGANDRGLAGGGQAGGGSTGSGPTGSDPTGSDPTGSDPTGSDPTGGSGGGRDGSGSGSGSTPTEPSNGGPEPTPSGPAPLGSGPTPVLPNALPPSLTPTGLVPRGGPTAPKYGPYPNGGRSVLPAIRQWQAQNPGTRFLD